MANKMLIDAAHPEETRVVVLRGSRVEEFDFESANKKQLRGNIYLAKVTRVEPSLQAAFVDYGGNRHGFLAFSEIHPDYYQIPFSDRQALLDAEMHEEQDEEEERKPKRSRRRRGGDRNAAAARHSADETVSEDAGHDEAPDTGEAAAHAPATDHATEDHALEGQVPEDHALQSHAHEGPGAPAGTRDALRPTERDATETPPYDDPTAGLIEHASQVHAGDEAAADDHVQAGDNPADHAAAASASHAGAGPYARRDDDAARRGRAPRATRPSRPSNRRRPSAMPRSTPARARRPRRPSTTMRTTMRRPRAARGVARRRPRRG